MRQRAETPSPRRFLVEERKSCDLSLGLCITSAFTLWRHRIIVPDEAEMLVLFNTQDVMAARNSEIKIYRENGVFEEVENEGQTVISTRWAVTEKQKGKEVITKARLVPAVLKKKLQI